MCLEQIQQIKRKRKRKRKNSFLKCVLNVSKNWIHDLQLHHPWLLLALDIWNISCRAQCHQLWAEVHKSSAKIVLRAINHLNAHVECSKYESKGRQGCKMRTCISYRDHQTQTIYAWLNKIRHMWWVWFRNSPSFPAIFEIRTLIPDGPTT